MSARRGVREPLSPFHLVERIFGEGGALQQRVPGYAPRPEQMALVSAYTHHLVFHGNAPFVSEAPCGTGKTFAYLVPAILSLFSGPHFQGLMVTTAGISLQSQLVQRDIPAVLDLLDPYLNLRPPVFLAKGISNYLCVKKLEDPELKSELGKRRLPLLKEWIKDQDKRNPTEYGDLAEAPVTPPPEVLPLITTSSEDCLGDSCPQVASCFHRSRAAKRRNAGPCIVVTNHHLYAVHLAEKGNHYTVVDEAHELPAIMRGVRSEAFDPTFWADSLARLKKAESLSSEGADLLQKMAALPEPVSLVPMGEGIRRIPPLGLGPHKGLLHRLIRSLPVTPDAEVLRNRIDSLQKKLSLLEGEEEENARRIFLPEERKIECVSLSAEMGAHAYFSATIRHAGGYEPFLEQIKPTRTPRTFTTRSPFDWGRQALICFPKEHMLDPKAPREAYDQRLADTSVEIVRLSKGRALFACTSWASVRAVAARLREESEYQVLVQGEQPKEALLAAFRQDVSSVLVGTLSLWTGVDVPGEALSCLVIDKIPFRGGTDPWVEAHRLAGDDWFNNRVLPHVSNLLAQGFGRMIRSTKDVGACVILDPRLHPESRVGYGHVLRASLPQEARLSYNLEDVGRWLAPRELRVHCGHVRPPGPLPAGHPPPPAGAGSPRPSPPHAEHRRRRVLERGGGPHQRAHLPVGRGGLREADPR